MASMPGIKPEDGHGKITMVAMIMTVTMTMTDGYSCRQCAGPAMPSPNIDHRPLVLDVPTHPSHTPQLASSICIYCTVRS